MPPDEIVSTNDLRARNEALVAAVDRLKAQLRHARDELEDLKRTRSELQEQLAACEKALIGD